MLITLINDENTSHLFNIKVISSILNMENESISNKLKFMQSDGFRKFFEKLPEPEKMKLFTENAQIFCDFFENTDDSNNVVGKYVEANFDKLDLEKLQALPRKITVRPEQITKFIPSDLRKHSVFTKINESQLTPTDKIPIFNYFKQMLALSDKIGNEYHANEQITKQMDTLTKTFIEQYQNPPLSTLKQAANIFMRIFFALDLIIKYSTGYNILYERHNDITRAIEGLHHDMTNNLRR